MTNASHSATQVQILDVATIIPGLNDRTVFEAGKLRELADSIREAGRLLQPITVRRLDAENVLYEIIAGERRYRACTTILGWAEIPAQVIDATDEEASGLMLAENIARADLDPVDEGRAYKTRMERFGWSVEECAQRAGVIPWQVKSRVGMLRLLPDILDLVRKKIVGIRFAQLMDEYGLDTPQQQRALYALKARQNPTVKWFKEVIETLKQEQAQGVLFAGLGLLDAITARAKEKKGTPPPDPMKFEVALVSGSDLPDMLSRQQVLWAEAAVRWEEEGKSGKASQCEAIARILATILQTQHKEKGVFDAAA